MYEVRDSDLIVVVVGRPSVTPEKISAIRALGADRNKSPAEICKVLGVSRATFYKYGGGAAGPAL